MPTDFSEKEKHKKHREKNLIAKHLRESGLYRLKVIKPKTSYKRKKIKVKDVSPFLLEEDIDKLINEE